MHELSICRALLVQLEKVCAEHRARAVTKVCVQIGPLAGVEPRLLREAFTVASADSVAQHAELQIEELPLRVQCDSCGVESEARPNHLICDACGDWHTRLISGDEMGLVSVELIN